MRLSLTEDLLVSSAIVSRMVLQNPNAVTASGVTTTANAANNNNSSSRSSSRSSTGNNSTNTNSNISSTNSSCLRIMSNGDQSLSTDSAMRPVPLRSCSHSSMVAPTRLPASEGMGSPRPLIDLLVAMIAIPVLILCALQLEKNLHEMVDNAESRWLVFALGIGMLIVSVIICGYVTHRMGVCMWAGPIDEHGQPAHHHQPHHAARSGSQPNHHSQMQDGGGDFLQGTRDALPPSYESVVKYDVPPPSYECLVIEIEANKELPVNTLKEGAHRPSDDSSP